MNTPSQTAVARLWGWVDRWSVRSAKTGKKVREIMPKAMVSGRMLPKFRLHY